jgi:hypothetical protein
MTMRLPFLLLAIAGSLAAQKHDLVIDILGNPQTPKLAVPDFRGDAQAQPGMAAFNETLWRDLDDSAYFSMIPKSQYPVTIPQQPAEMRAREWSSPPAQVDYVARFGGCRGGAKAGAPVRRRYPGKPWRRLSLRHTHLLRA